MYGQDLLRGAVLRTPPTRTLDKWSPRNHHLTRTRNTVIVLHSFSVSKVHDSSSFFSFFFNIYIYMYIYIFFLCCVLEDIDPSCRSSAIKKTREWRSCGSDRIGSINSFFFFFCLFFCLLNCFFLFVCSYRSSSFLWIIYFVERCDGHRRHGTVWFVFQKLLITCCRHCNRRPPWRRENRVLFFCFF